MANSGLAMILPALLLTSGLAATLHESTLVRREEKSVGVSSNGQFIQGDNQASTSCASTCAKCAKYDYLLGTPNSNDCGSDTLVTDEDECRYAACAGEAFASELKMHIEASDYAKRPYGCFHHQCTDNGNVAGPCYWLNHGSATLSNPTEAGFAGTPVCKRLRYVDGATDAQDGCPAEYEVVKDEDLCRKLCEFEDYSCNGDFRIGINNYTRHHDFPEGCFHQASTNASNTLPHVYFNEVSAGTSVAGTVMCKVQTPMNWTSSPPSGFTSDGSQGTATATDDTTATNDATTTST